MSVLFIGGVDGTIADVTAYNANWNLLEGSLFDLGPYIISGLAVTVGTGLSVNVALGVASIGGRVSKAAGFTVGALTPSTVNHLYLQIDGTGTANTTAVAPANSVKLATATTDGSGVTAVGANWASGRQIRRRTEDLVHGSGAGHPRAVDLSSWHATNNESNEVKGALPAGATSGITKPITAKTANYAVAYTDNIILCNATGGSFTVTLPTAVGHSGSAEFTIKKTDSSANVVHIQTTSSQTIDGVAPPKDIITGGQSLTLISDGSNYWII